MQTNRDMQINFTQYYSLFCASVYHILQFAYIQYLVHYLYSKTFKYTIFSTLFITVKPISIYNIDYITYNSKTSRNKYI